MFTCSKFGCLTTCPIYYCRMYFKSCPPAYLSSISAPFDTPLPHYPVLRPAPPQPCFLPPMSPPADLDHLLLTKNVQLGPHSCWSCETFLQQPRLASDMENNCHCLYDLFLYSHSRTLSDQDLGL